MFGINANIVSSSIFSSVESYSNPASKTYSATTIYWKPSVGYFAEIGTIKENFLNFKLGYNYENYRTVNFFVIKNSSGVEQTLYPTSTTAQFKMSDVYLDSAYRWEKKGYLIVGINYSFPDFIAAPSVNPVTVTTTSKTGFEFGGGLLFADEMFAIELIRRMRFYNLKIVDTVTGFTDDYGTGLHDQLNLNFKILF